MKSGFGNWSDVRVFLAVLRNGSTLAASRELGIAQPTVARRIDALEHALKLTLFERDTRGFRPTANARALVGAAEAAERAMAALERDAATCRRADAEVIRVTAAGPFLEELVSEVFAEFADTHPGLRYEYFASGDIVDMEAGEADIALRATRQPTGTVTLCRRLPDFTYGIFCTQDYIDRHGCPSGPGDLPHHDIVGYTGPVAASDAYHWLAAQVPDGRFTTRCNNQASACRILKGGNAVGMVSHLVARRQGGLVRCFAPPPELATRLWLLISPQAGERRVVRELIDFSVDLIADRVRRNNAWP